MNKTCSRLRSLIVFLGLYGIIGFEEARRRANLRFVGGEPSLWWKIHLRWKSLHAGRTGRKLKG